MKRPILIILLLLANVFSTFSMRGQAPLLTLEVQMSPTALPFSAVQVNLLLRNASTKQVLLLNPHQLSSISVEIRDAATGSNYYNGPLIVTRAIADGLIAEYPMITLEPNGIFSSNQILRCNWNGEVAKPLFEKPGGFRLQFTWLIRALSEGTRTNLVTRSEGIDLSVVEPNDSERRVFARIESVSFPGMLLFPEDISFLSKTNLDMLESELDGLLKDFPESSYSLYATRARAEVFLARGLRLADRARLEEYRKALPYLDALRNSTNFALARDTVESRRSVRGLVGLPDDTPAPAQVVISPAASTPTNPFALATLELTALRYDLRGFARDHPQEGKEHVGKVLLLSDEMAMGRISRDVFDQRRAALLREYITNYSRPLSAEEWSRRQAAYATEDAAREQREQTELQRYTIEADRILRDKPKQPSQPK